MNTKTHYSLSTGVWLAALALLLLAFVGVTLTVRTTPYFPFELNIARALQAIQIPGFDALMKAVSLPGYPPQVNVEVVLVAALMWFVVGRWEAVSFTFATIGVSAGGVGVKLFIDRARPTPDLMRVVNVLNNGRQSYPAGHVEVYVALLGFLIFLLWMRRPHKLWQSVLMVLLGAMIVLIGPSRIYMGEHWFTDVVGAYLFGLIWLLLTIRFYEWGKARFWKKQRDSVSTDTGALPTRLANNTEKTP